MKKEKSYDAIFEASLLFHFKTKTKPKSQGTWRSQATFSFTCLWLSLLFGRSWSYLFLPSRSLCCENSLHITFNFPDAKALTSWIYIPADHSVTRILFTSLPGSRHGGTFQRTIVFAGSLTGLNWELKPFGGHYMVNASFVCLLQIAGERGRVKEQLCDFLALHWDADNQSQQIL